MDLKWFAAARRRGLLGRRRQMKHKRYVLGEWIMKISGPGEGYSGRVQVAVENVDRRDLRFAQALARLTEVWIAARGVTR